MKNKLIYVIPCFLFLSLAMTCGDYDRDPFLSIHHIETIHVNNEKEFPFISEEPIKKEAYLIGAKYFTVSQYKEGGEVDHFPLMGFDFLVDTIYRTEITSNRALNEEFPAGSDISSCFTRTLYVPYDVTESYVLRVVPQPGIYTFFLRFYSRNGKLFESETSPIELY